MAIATSDDQHHPHNGSSKSMTSYKRARAVVPELPSSVAWLEHTTLEMTATAHKSLAHCSTEYLLHVHHRTSASASSKKPQTWQVSRTYEDYVEFQQRLLKTLAYGHSCSAECKWLHSFAKKYFPKKALFGNCSTTTMNLRREKLIRYMNVLKSSLLNRGNHGCSIVVNSLANEFAVFIEGHHRVVEEEAHVEDERVRRCSISSSISTSSTDAGEDDHDHDDQHIDDLDNICDLCNCYLDGSDTSSDSACNVDGSSCDTTTLTCGHQFHDGCVLPQLAAFNYCCPSCSQSQL